jgi:hypothetical protein
MLGFLFLCLFFALLVGLFKLGGRLYRKLYWWDRRQQMKHQVRRHVDDRKLFATPVEEMFRDGEF